MSRRVGRLICRIGLHRWDYHGNAWSHAPARSAVSGAGVCSERVPDSSTPPKNWRTNE